MHGRLTNFTLVVPSIHLELELTYAMPDGGHEFGGFFPELYISLTPSPKEDNKTEPSASWNSTPICGEKHDGAKHKKKAPMVEPMATKEETTLECLCVLALR